MHIIVALSTAYAEQVQVGWICPDPATVHWDGKHTQDLQNKYKKKDRLPILVSGENTTKLIGAPALLIKSSEIAGKLVSDEVMILLKK